MTLTAPAPNRSGPVAALGRWLRGRSSDAEHGDALPSDRAAVAGDTTPSVTARINRWLGFGLVGAVTGGMLIWYYLHAFDRSVHARRQAAGQSLARAEGESTLPPLGLIKPPSAPDPAAPAGATPGASGSGYLIGNVLGDPTATTDGDLGPDADSALDGSLKGSPRAPATSSNVKSPAQLAVERRLGARVFAHVGGTTPTPPGAAAPEAEDAFDAVPAAPIADAPAPGALATFLKSDVTPAVPAALLPTRRLLLPKGSFIDCTLETAIDSTLPGLATCLTAVDTYSADGKVVLLERGTKLIGETRGEVGQGAARIFVLWSEARTPNGVTIPLASPGTDELGRSGLPGKVTRHFFQRFGAAILLSIIDGAIQVAAASQAQAGEGTTVVLNPTTTHDVTTEVLKGTIAIPPTVRKRQGDRIQILVARDIDFRSVYALRVP
jgi:type IV secretion system protein VirB10